MFNKKTMLGIAIDAGCISIVKRNGRGQLIKWAVEAVPDHLIKQGMITSEKKLALFIRKILKKSKIRGKKCAVCLSCDKIIVRELYFPAAVKDALMDNVRYEMSEYIPLDTDNYVIDYRILDSSTSSKGNIIRVMAAAVPKEIVDGFVRVFKLARLKPLVIDIPPNCQERWYSEYISGLEDGSDENRSVLLIHMGAFSIRFTLLHEGIYYIDKISSAIENENNGINMELLLEEIQGMLNFYYARSPEHKISKIILMADRKYGDISGEQIKQRTGISVYVFKMPVDDNNIICLPNAVGAAAAKLNEKMEKRINLLTANEKSKKGIYRLSTVLLTVLLGLGIAIRGFLIPIWDKYEILDEIEAQEMEKDSYISIFNDYQKIKNEIEYLKSKKQELNKVISSQKLLSHLLEVVDSCLPANAYIIEFSTDNSSIRLFGTADNDNTVVEFLTALSSTGEFNRVFVDEIVLDQDTGLKLFSLQCDVDIYSDADQENFDEN